MGIKQEVDVVKQNNRKTSVCVDDIITGVQQCKIDNNDSNGKELAHMLINLNLDDSKDNKLQNIPDSLPVEDYQRDVRATSPQHILSDNLITLEAPNDDDNEDDEEDSPQLKHEDKETKLEERGPMFGVPANHNLELRPCNQLQFQANFQNVDNHHHQSPLPSGFPDYSLQPCRTSQAKGPKRGMDDRESYQDVKFVRPQNAGMGKINNVIDSWNVPSSGPSNVNGKSVTKVYRTQMSGGTVYAPENIKIPFTDDLNDHFSSPDQLEFQDLLDESVLNIQGRDSFDFLKGVMNPQALGQMSQMPCKTSVGLQQQWRNPQSPLTLAGQYTNSVNLYQQQPQFENYHHQSTRQYHESGQGKRGSFGNDDCSDGYGSDLSPSHEVQSPPAASPCSVMEASPATLGGSPPRTNWSPPPSNMSHSSVDSGVCSPMADEQNGYNSVISPRQGHAMSPQTRMISSSPPHQYVSPPAFTTYQTVAQDKQTIPRDEAYVDPYIDAHLTDLDWALEVASQDLMLEKLRKGFPVSSSINSMTATTSSIGSQVTKTIDNINKDIYTGRVTMPPPIAMVPQFVGNNRRDNISGTNPCTIQPRRTTPQVSQYSQKSDTISNLPRTVPATIANLNNTNIYQPSTIGCGQTNGNLNLDKVQSIPGKIAIAPINPKSKSGHCQSVMLPVFVTKEGMVIMPTNVQQNPPPRKLPTIFPKEPVKQKEQTIEINIKPANVGNPPAGNGGHGKKSNASTHNGKKTAAPQDETKLNLARRLVAEMSPADLKYKDEDGDMYLHVAVCHADSFMVQALLERLARENLTEMIIDMQNSEGQTPLYLAVSTNHTEMVQLLVEQGADVNPFAESETSSGYVEKTAAIHCASTKGEKYLKTLKALLKAPQINLNQANSDGHTALICAILAHGKMTTDKTLVNSIPIIRALMQAGADPNLQVQQSGKTALMYALESRDLDLIENIFQLVDPQKLPVFLNTMAFDSSNCLRIAESLRPTLDPNGQQRLLNSLRNGSSRGFLGSLS